MFGFGKKKEEVKVEPVVPQKPDWETWLEEELKKPLYVIEVDTGIDLLISNTFDPYASAHVRKTSRDVAIQRTYSNNTFLVIQVGVDHYTIPVSSIITMKVRPVSNE
jgi:hypothetical protein